MKKKSLSKIEIAFVIVFFIGNGVLPSISGNTNESRNVEIVNDVEHPLQLTVTIMYPGNGIYCNNQKILPFCVPLVLYGNISMAIEIKPLSEIDMVEFYINGELLCTITTPPFEFGNGTIPFRKPFSRMTVKVIAYGTDGIQDSDEIVIWRIFP